MPIVAIAVEIDKIPDPTRYIEYPTFIIDGSSQSFSIALLRIIITVAKPIIPVKASCQLNPPMVLTALAIVLID